MAPRLPLTRAAPHGRCRRLRGFTLIELMVTLAIFAILSLLAMPSFNTWIANNRVRAMSEDMANGLRLAQTEALRRSALTVFALVNTPDPTGGAANVNENVTYTAVATGATNWAVSVAPSTTANTTATFVHGGAIADIASGVTIKGPPAVCFDALGRLVTDATAIANTSTGVGAQCSALPNAATPAQIYSITSASPAGDHPLQIEVGLGGQVRLCNPAQSLTGTTQGASEGCQYPQATP
jgi:type IV fimbrial biogenesis protein FimT